MSRDRWNGDWPPRSKPLRPADGIRAQSKRGAFASGWWAKRWIAALESFQLGARIARGRAYARGGQVTQIALELGGVRAQVQGSRPKPYDVTIRVRELGTAAWRAVGAAIGNDLRLSAALLAGDMPEDIEAAFAAAGTSLFPTSIGEMKTACSCPDWSNPCKHIAAVFYLIGEEFDRDPFLLFVVRGLAREAVRDLFGPAPEPIALESPPARMREAAGSRAGKPPSPARLSPDAFWGDNSAEPDSSRMHVVATASNESAELKRAGKFPFWRGDIALRDALVPIYDDAAVRAIDWLADHAETPPE
jgi:uncharacterized Zn finger protein